MRTWSDLWGDWILLSDSSDRFASEFRSGALAYACEQRMTGVRLVGDRELSAVLRAIPVCQRARVAYVGGVRDLAVMRELKERGIPCVLFGEDTASVWREQLHAPVAACATDHRAVGRMAAGHLQEQCRFRSYAYVDARTKRSWQWWADLRYEGFVSELRQRGERVAVPRLSVQDGAPEADLRMLLKRLRSLPAPVGVFCCNDRVAHEVSVFCQAGGLHVPEDVAILGVDDARDICENAPVALSSVRVDRTVLGWQAMAMARELLTGRRAPRNETFRCPPAGVVARESTRSAVYGDLFVAKAVKLIDGRPSARMTIAWLVAKTGASRSYLERHFKAATGETIHAYMEGAIVRAAQHQLVTTDASVSFISSTLGFETTSYLCTKFRKRVGMTMQEYRRAHQVPKKNATSIVNGAQK